MAIKKFELCSDRILYEVKKVLIRVPGTEVRKIIYANVINYNLLENFGVEFVEL